MAVFEKLNRINVNDRTEEKNGLKYLSWAWAWAEFKKACPDAKYEIWKDADGKPYIYDDKLGYMVMVEVTADGESHSMWLPVMDGANKAMKDHPYQYLVKNRNFKYAKWNPEKKGYFDQYGNEQKEYTTKTVEQATMFDINTAIMRCLTKCLAMFGLGLYIYAGEDIPQISVVPPVEPLGQKNRMKVLNQFCADNSVNLDAILAWYKVQNVEQMDEGRCTHFNNNFAMFVR